MKHILLLLAFLSTTVTIRAQVISIAQARALGTGTTVTVRGIVTNGDEMGKIRYIQDGTAGLAAFPGNGSLSGFETTVHRGDSIEVTGTLVSFQNLLEMSPITAYTVISTNNPAPAPKSVTLAQFNETLESQLISVDCTVFANGGNIFSGSSTYDISDADGYLSKVFVRSAHPLIGTTIPPGPIHLVAILSRYGEFQLLPRDAADFTPGACFFGTDKPTQSNIQPTTFDITWHTNLTSEAYLDFGSSLLLGQTTAITTSNIVHTVTLSNLSPGTIYWTQATSIYNNDTIKSEIIPFATRSLSSGAIEVYFNHAIDNQFVGNKQPGGVTGEACLAAVIQKIDDAQQTIDVAMYNNSREDIVDALKAAHNRGVRVRYVAALNATSPALNPAPAFPVVYGNNIALMHNKFMCIDAGITDKAWVMGGSMNWTDNNIFDDFNNLLFIQDQSLARAYELEFEEMWGSEGANPDPLNERFGNLKKDNTPHQFIIAGIPVDNWFSPSDNVTGKIVKTVETANASAEFAMFSFTKNEIADALVAKYNNEEVEVRGLMENINDSGSEYFFLNGQGIPVGQHYQPYQLHHKYVIVDALLPVSDPLVLTGSHNWSQTAEDQNDENTLRIHDSDIARLYRAEFEKRTAENPVSVQTIVVTPFRISPNPAWNSFMIKCDQFDLDTDTEVQIWNQMGQLLSSAPFVSGQAISTTHLQDGSYIIKIKGRNAFAALPLQKISR